MLRGLIVFGFLPYQSFKFKNTIGVFQVINKAVDFPGIFFTLIKFRS